MEAVVGQVGLGPWGTNLARNFNELARLKWLCDSDAGKLDGLGARFPGTKFTTRIDDLLTDPEVEAIIIATPVSTHATLARRALAEKKHVFVEKPMALTAGEAEELLALANEHGRVLMPGHLLLYHPGVAKLKELVDAGELGEILYVYGNRQNLGTIRRDENALWSLGVHDLSVILHLLAEEPSEVSAFGESYMQPGIEDVVFCFLRFPSGKIAHMHLSWLDPHKVRRMTVVGRDKMAVFDDMELDHKVTIYDKAAWQPAERYGEWQTRTGAKYSPRISNDEPLKLECRHFLELVRNGPGDHAEARAGLAVVRTLELLQTSLAGVPA